MEPLEARLMMAAFSPLAVPALASRPSAPATLYLDFNGHVEPRWGNHANVTTPPYDTDGNTSSFSAAEIAAINEIFARVAEDYAPLNVNVTTVEPAVIADRKSARVAIGGWSSDWYGRSAGGVSYVGGFAGPSSNVAYVFAKSLGGGNPRFVAEAASHEAGHLFGLEHHAKWNGPTMVAAYDAGDASLAPIMGNGYYAERTTWTRGLTDNGPTAIQDDLAVLASSANGFGYAPDDHGDTLASARALTLAGGKFAAAGVIGRETDRDLFKVTTTGGRIDVSVNVAQVGANLDASLELQNATGQRVALASPADSLKASISATVAAGTYYLVVRASGGYGNLGRYSVQGAVSSTSSVPSPAPPPVIPEGESTPATGVRIVEDGGAGFTGNGTWKRAMGSGYAGDVQYAAAGSNASATWTLTGLPPGQYRLAASWTGSALNAADALFTVSSGSASLGAVRVNQQRSSSTFMSDGASWQNLGTFTVAGSTITIRLNSSATGRVVADAIRLERVFSTSSGK